MIEEVKEKIQARGFAYPLEMKRLNAIKKIQEQKVSKLHKNPVYHSPLGDKKPLFMRIEESFEKSTL